MNMKKLILVLLTILLGIVLALKWNGRDNSVERVFDKRDSIFIQPLKKKELHIPKYLSSQIISYKEEDRKNRAKPRTDAEKSIAYFEDNYAMQYEKKSEVYERNGSVYTNFKGIEKLIASHNKPDVPMMPKFSFSKQYISYTLCEEANNSCNLMVEGISFPLKRVLGESGNASWSPQSDILVFDRPESEDGEVLSKSEIFLYNTFSDTLFQMTDTVDFIETNPIVSKDGERIYCADEKSNRLVYFPLYRYKNRENIEAVSVYKTSENSLEIAEIKKRSRLFEPISSTEHFSESNKTYWIEMIFSEKMKSGLYYINARPFLFDKNSFTQKQLELNATQRDFVGDADDSFVYFVNYKAGIDPKSYYFRLGSYKLLKPFTYGLSEVITVGQKAPEIHKEYIAYTHSKTNFIYTVLASMVIGMILMSALYTAVIYLYRREKEFIYYTLMQVSMALFLFYPYTFFQGLFRVEFLSMPQLTLLVALFATLFTQAFLRTKEFLPILHSLLNFYLVMIVADMIWVFEPILMKYKLYEVFGLLFLLSAFLRAKDGFRPAWFYLLGWVGLLSAIFAMDYFQVKDFMMYIGVFIEAIMLAWGLVYRQDVLGKKR